MSSSPDRIESQRWVPPGLAPPRKAPCVVFLHGFGGALTLYLRAIAESPIGERFVIVAPALDNEGAWSGPRGHAVLERVLDQLPEVVDRSQVFVVGLSNGAIGASVLLAQPALRDRLAGVVLVSGIASVDRRAAVPGTRALVVTGIRDPRFPHAWVTTQADALRSAGAEVEQLDLDADHYLVLTHAPQWTARFLAWSRRGH